MCSMRLLKLYERLRTEGYRPWRATQPPYAGVDMSREYSTPSRAKMAVGSATFFFLADDKGDSFKSWSCHSQAFRGILWWSLCAPKGCRLKPPSFRKKGSVKEEDVATREVFKCCLCDGIFASEERLSEHQESVHVRRGEEHQCRFCPYSSSRKESVQRHERVHTGARPYVCRQCSVRFVQRAHYVKHLRIVHEEGRCHQCSTCGHKFQWLCHLQEHERIHRDERPYVCQHCGKAFVKKFNLCRHLLSH